MAFKRIGLERISPCGAMASCPLCHGSSKIISDGTGKKPMLIKCAQCGFSIESNESIMDPSAILEWNDPHARWWAMFVDSRARGR